MSEMFCFQCQEAAGGKGCTNMGVCGKTSETANLQDALVYILKEISNLVIKAESQNIDINRPDDFVIDSLFMTITNANFDNTRFIETIKEALKIKSNLQKKLDVKNKGFIDKLKDKLKMSSTNDVLDWASTTKKDIVKFSQLDKVGVLSTEDEDVRSLRELITYGLKGMAAYAQHAKNLDKENKEVSDFIFKALHKITDDSLSVDQLVSLTLETGKYGVDVMALLDEANTSAYGHPEITEVNIGTKDNPAILISGHDLKDMEKLLKQTEGTGVDVYTHSEMLPANYYPEFKKYDHFVGNYGNAWWKQKEEFESFNGPILFTTNCIVPPEGEVANRIFTSGSAGFEGCTHIDEDEDGNKDFSEIIEMAKTLDSPKQIEKGKIVGGFAHNQVMELADKVIDAVKEGDIKQFFVMAGCDGRQKDRNYYEDFAKAIPEDTVILTAGCAKYRYNKLDLGDIGGIPRVLDAGQCNDSYSLAAIAMELQKAFDLDDINELPISYNIAWYEQKAVIVLLALLSLGVKDIHLGPTLPAFLSENVANVLVNEFGIAGIGEVEDDIDLFLNN